jgi:hypothetical protein
LISLFTEEQEVVLDPFNGSGTTTLTAEQLKRNFIGIELSKTYHDLALRRHENMKFGIDPFAKNYGIPKTKNSLVKRLTTRRYLVSKKVLQLEVKKIAQKLGRMPMREDVQKLSKYPMSYFNEYFISWGEVCAAARTTGMSETQKKNENKICQLDLFP